MQDELVAHHPHPDDVVVQQQRAGDAHYTVGISKSGAQLICSTREHALAVATSYARAAAVRVWQIDNQDRWSLIFERDAAVI